MLTDAACPTITFAPGVTNITLAGTKLTVERDVTIDGGSGVTISGNNLSSVFYVNSGVSATFTGLTITGGNTLYEGGGILNRGTLTIDGTISNNRANGPGGGIHNTGTVTVSGTIINNTTVTGGGGISNSGIMTVRGIIINNTAGGVGCGIDNSGMLTVSGTISNNRASDGAGIYHSWPRKNRLIFESGARVMQNQATNIGGGIFKSYSSIITGATATTVFDNIAPTCNNYYNLDSGCVLP